MDKITQVLFSDIGKVTTQYVEVPHQQLKPHEVRIAPVFYGICGSDLHVLKGGHPFAKPPVVPGHEIAARVTEVGSDVKNVQPGDHVVVDPIMACMECRACKAGRFNLCEPPQVAGFRAPGFARSQHIVPARNCHVAPASLPLKVLAFAEPAACARHCVNRMPKASLESVLVIGAGTIGLSIVQALRIMGAGKITVIEPDAAKRALALKLGAAEVWAPSGPREIPLPMMQRFERDLLNSGMYIPEDFDAVIEWLADGRFDTSELVTDLFAIEDAAAAFERAQQNDSIKVMLQFAPE